MEIYWIGFFILALLIIPDWQDLVRMTPNADNKYRLAVMVAVCSLSWAGIMLAFWCAFNDEE